MLTEANLKEHLLKAYFVDENRTLIEVLYTSLDFKEHEGEEFSNHAKDKDIPMLVNKCCFDKCAYSCGIFQ